MFTQRTHRADRHHVRNAGALQHIDVGAKIDIRWRKAVAATMSRQKYERLTRQLAEEQLIGGSPKGEVTRSQRVLLKPSMS